MYVDIGIFCVWPYMSLIFSPLYKNLFKFLWERSLNSMLK